MYLEVVEVRDNRDPTGNNRVKVRAYNKENNEQEIPDEGLRWAHPLMPVTDLTINGIGTRPPAPLIGTVLLVTFLPEDTLRQSPIYIGGLVRSEIDEMANGIQKRDPKTGGPGENSAQGDMPGRKGP